MANERANISRLLHKYLVVGPKVLTGDRYESLSTQSQAEALIARYRPPKFDKAVVHIQRPVEAGQD